VASSWFLFFSYHNDARSNTHQILECLLYIVTLQVCLGIQDRHIHVFSLGSVDSGQQAPTIMFQHSLHNIMRYSQTYNNHCTFMYLLRDTVEPLLYCYLYQASDPNDVSTKFIFRYKT